MRRKRRKKKEKIIRNGWGLAKQQRFSFWSAVSESEIKGQKEKKKKERIRTDGMQKLSSPDSPNELKIKRLWSAHWGHFPHFPRFPRDGPYFSKDHVTANSFLSTARAHWRQACPFPYFLPQQRKQR